MYSETTNVCLSTEDEIIKKYFCNRWNASGHSGEHRCEAGLSSVHKDYIVPQHYKRLQNVLSETKKTNVVLTPVPMAGLTH